MRASREYIYIYIYNFFPPSHLRTPPPARLAIVWGSTWDTSCHIRKMASCYILSKNWFFTVAFFFSSCWKLLCFYGRSGRKESGKLEYTHVQSWSARKILLWFCYHSSGNEAKPQQHMRFSCCDRSRGRGCAFSCILNSVKILLTFWLFLLQRMLRRWDRGMECPMEAHLDSYKGCLPFVPRVFPNGLSLFEGLKFYGVKITFHQNFIICGWELGQNQCCWTGASVPPHCLKTWFPKWR